MENPITIKSKPTKSKVQAIDTLKVLKFKKYTTSHEKDQCITTIKEVLKNDSPESKVLKKEIEIDPELRGIFGNKKSHGMLIATSYSRSL